MNERVTTRNFGGVSVTLRGASGPALETTRGGGLASFHVPWSHGARVVAAFQVPPGHAAHDDHVGVSISAPFDPELLVAVVARELRVVLASASPLGAALSFEVLSSSRIVRLFLFASAGAVETFLRAIDVHKLASNVDMTEYEEPDAADEEPEDDEQDEEEEREEEDPDEAEEEQECEEEEPDEEGELGDDDLGVSVSEGGGFDARRRGIRYLDSGRGSAQAATPSRPRAELAPNTVAHVLGEMSRTTEVGQETTVAVTLSWSAPIPHPGTAFDQAEVPIDPELPVTVSIATRGYRLAPRTRYRRVLRFPASRSKTSIKFRVEAVVPGSAEVTVIVRQSHELPVATLRIMSDIVKTVETAPVPVIVRADAVTPDPDVTDLPTIRIDESIVRSNSVLNVAVQIGETRIEGRTCTIDKQKVVADTYGKIAALRASLRREEPGEREAIMKVGLEGLRTIGVDLARRVFSPDVRQFLWDHVDKMDGLFIQTTGEFNLPWEMIYVSDPSCSVQDEPRVEPRRFLGMLGATRWVYGMLEPTRVTVRPKRAKYLCPDYLEPNLGLAFTRDEATFVRELSGGQVVTPGTSRGMAKVMAAECDLLHFGGHGVWLGTPPDQRLLLAQFRSHSGGRAGASYSASDLRRDLPDRALPGDVTDGEVLSQGKAPSMVFLNACDVGRLQSVAPDGGGFPETFLRGGASVFVGCAWAVNDRGAAAFVRRFYEALDVADMGAAIAHARHASLEEDYDLSALAYVAYTHPHTTVSLSP